MEENEIKCCPVKKVLFSKNVLVVIACLLCFFIGYYAGSKTAKTSPRGINNSFRGAPQMPRRINPPVKMPTKLPQNITPRTNLPKQAPIVNTQKPLNAPKTNIPKNINVSAPTAQKNINNPALQKAPVSQINNNQVPKETLNKLKTENKKDKIKI